MTEEKRTPGVNTLTCSIEEILQLNKEELKTALDNVSGMDGHDYCQMGKILNEF